MANQLSSVALCAALLAQLSACSTLDANRDVVRAQSESNPAGSKGLLMGDELRYMNVAALVRSFVPQPGGVAYGLIDPNTLNPAQEQQALDDAVAAFYVNVDSEKQAQFRNEIQDRLIAASNQRCHLWKNYFATSSSTVGFWSSIVGTMTGAAATAFSPTSTKNALTATATTFNAIGAEYEKSYLFNLSMQVVFQGVEGRRTSIYKTLAERRVTDQKLSPITQYTLSAAIADALEYHAACSVASGLQQASEKLADSRSQQTKSDKPSETPTKPGESPPVAGKANESNTATPVPPVPAAASSNDGRTSSPTSVPLPLVVDPTSEPLVARPR